MARQRSAGYKRRDPHPPCYLSIHTCTPNPLAVPDSPFTVSAAVSTTATKTTNYCKTSQITFQLTSSHCKPKPINKEKIMHSLFLCFWHGKAKEGPLWWNSIMSHLNKSQYLSKKAAQQAYCKPMQVHKHIFAFSCVCEAMSWEMNAESKYLFGNNMCRCTMNL